MTDFPTTRIGGVPIHMAGFDNAVAFAEERIRAQTPGYICHVSVHGITEAQNDPAFAAALEGAVMAATDGMPLVWVGRARGYKAERVYGPDFMRALLARTAGWRDRSCRHFFYGSSPMVLEKLVTRVKAAYPDAIIVGTISPPFRPLSEEEERRHLSEIDGAGTDVLWVGLGAPRQELWMARNRPHLKSPLIIGVGAAFDFLAEVKPQAPAWLRSHGLEWAFRLVTEPRRLASRYLNIIPRFLVLLASEALGRGR